jgi:hypothetical protein
VPPDGDSRLIERNLGARHTGLNFKIRPFHSREILVGIHGQPK